MNDFDYLTTLPGEERERKWLQERLETLSVQESYALAAATQSDPPMDMIQAINQLQSLDDYEIHLNAGSYEALGQAYLRNETRMPESALLFVDLARVGRNYEDEHPGLFVGNCYVEYPKKAPEPVYQRGGPLPEDNGWGVKLKLASPAVPEGVWLRLPGANPYGDESSTEEALALRELCVKRWDECDLLEARCVLPQVCNLTEQYDNVADLIYDGTSLGYVLAERGQGSSDFMERFTAALDLEYCHDLRFALDISQNLRCYNWVSCDDLEDSARGLLLDAGMSEELIHSCGIDLRGYKAYLLENEGYTLTADGSGYIIRNSQDFNYEFSTPTPEQSGMMMQ